MERVCPSGVSVSSNSDSSSSDEDDGSTSASCCPRHDAKRIRQSVVVQPRQECHSPNSVTVYQVFETSMYPPSMVSSMYTGRDELRTNKLRNKREYAYDLHDWGTEEEGMECICWVSWSILSIRMVAVV